MAEQSQNPAYLFDGYFGPAIFRPWAKRLIKTADVKPGERVLDLACAPGTVARLIAAKGRNTVTGLDFSPNMLEVARGASAPEGVTIDWIEGSADDLPFEDDHFDLVICQHGLQFFPDRAESAREIYRVLKPDGRLVASVWQDVMKQSLWGDIFEAVAKGLDAPMSEVALPFVMDEPRELHEYIEKGGFSDVRVTVQRMDNRFTEPSRFIQLSVTAAGASVPSFAAMDPETRENLIAGITESLTGKVMSQVEDDMVVMPTVLNQAVAFK